uniref:Putative secreted peptide n=1 Tax=Anopheles braziliensis TaxID=58242 RepID=A0A2M3ZQ24_9DIPT
MPLHYIMLLLLLLKMECSPKNSHKECNNRGNDAGIHRVSYQRSVSIVPGGRCRCRLLCMGCFQKSDAPIGMMQRNLEESLRGKTLPRGCFTHTTVTYTYET